ncbi:glycosyltransferase [Phenylobacterium sp. LjRoot219]|uniref:glycosyltransferase n=1 Tax=Phenylobacterium sp. LjRoot219 TaxID=3342283 RepID=UPI003ED136FD
MSERALPRVTAITGYYNRGMLLDRTLRSLLDQTYPNLEIIVFDDKSPDDTSRRLDAYEALGDPRLKIIRHETNLGFTRGMINAISQATGEYIAVQGSGDVSTPDRIAEQAAILQARPEVGVVGSHYENVVEERGIVRLRTPDADETTLESLARGNVFTHGEVMYRRSIYDAAGGYRPEFRYCQDYDLWLRMIRNCRFATVKKPLYQRYIQFEGVSYAPEKAAVQAQYFLLCQRMANLGEAERAATFEKLKASGPDALVPKHDPALQKRVLRNCLRLIAWGNAPQAERMSANLASAPQRLAVKVIGKAFSTPLLAAPRNLVFKALGIQGA